MKLADIKKEIQKYQYFEDTQIIDVSLASILSSRLSLGLPVWLVIIGASSGGKSQIIRPISMTDKAYIKDIDDLTENTFLSGAKMGKEQSGSNSLLKNPDGTNWSQGIMAISDLTVLFSKNAESRNTILSQFRMIYDGGMTKYSGNLSKPLQWKGRLGVISGSTPSIYRHFEEVADMGERFIYYRMKPYDEEKATMLALSRKEYGAELDEKLSELYEEYIKAVVLNSSGKTYELTPEVMQHITRVSMFAEKVRTPIAYDKYSKEVTHIPNKAFPMRVALQLTSVAKGLMAMQDYETGNPEIGPEQLEAIDWCGYSLANEEKRAVLKIFASMDFDASVSTQSVADNIGLSTTMSATILQNLASAKVLQRGGGSNQHTWKLISEKDHELIVRTETERTEVVERSITQEDNVEEKDDLDGILGW